MAKRTALYDEHVRLQGRIIDFGGWELPVQYTGLIDEHMACRSAAGLFDVSHMGEFFIDGPMAEGFLNHLVTNNVSRLAHGQALYTVMCHPTGGIVDDLVIYRRGPQSFFAIVNASNIDKDFANFSSVLKKFAPTGGGVALSNKSSDYSLIALQGRLAQRILSQITGADLAAIKTFHFCEGTICGDIKAIISRTGYTGEDGFEICVPWAEGPRVWRKLLEAGAPLGLKPCGLGARDTLRLEMKYPLYGQDLTDTTHPLEAGLGWVVKLDKPDFVGKSALLAAQENGLTRKLVGFKMVERAVPRHGYKLFLEDGKTEIGEVTSGTHAPSLNQGIGAGYLASKHCEVGSVISVKVRDRFFKAQICKTPFYSRPY